MLERTDRRTVSHLCLRAAIVPAGALAVHQLRYWLAFGGRAGLELAHQGHSYLHSLVPWIMLVIGVGAGGFLWALGRAMSGQRTLARYTVSVVALWAICSVCLLCIYVTQESLEGVFATGHPAGLVGIFGYGGWWSVPAATCVGLVLAVLFHGARWVLDEVAERSLGTSASPRPRTAPLPRPADALLPRLAPLAGGWSGRGPPS